MQREGSIVAGLLALALIAAADTASAVPLEGEIDWSGLYAGVQLGGGLNLLDVSDPFGASIYGDTVRTPGAFGGFQVGYNWQWGAYLLGLETDVDLASMNGTDTCRAFSGFYLSSNCIGSVDGLGTLTGRMGIAVGPAGSTLLYGKAGLAWTYGNVEAVPNGGLLLSSARERSVAWGYTLGAGAEQALDQNWSVRAEYDFLAFGDTGLAAPASLFWGAPNTPVGYPGAAGHVSQEFQTLKLGLNYRLDGGGGPVSPEPFTPRGPNGLEIEGGARYVAGWGRFQKDLGIPDQSDSSLASRLTYDGMKTNGAELFGRIDAPFNVMVKGMVGTGNGGGHMNDEDWDIPAGGGFPVDIPYSNTLSDVDNKIRYATIDVGYDLWRNPQHRLAWFIGYSFFHQNMQGFGCTQIANPNSDCVPPLPTSLLAITEVDQWNAMRLGAVADLMLAPGLKLTAEAAYLPFVSFTGADDHVLRALYSPEWGEGIGVQLEGVLSYAVTDWFSVGVGGRYWSMWTTQGNVDFGNQDIIVPMRFAAEQAALFVQGSYTFNTLP